MGEILHHSFCHSYSIDKMGNGLGFIVDVKIIICLPLGGNPICIPDDGFHERF
jgi:hypothetical protein